MSASLLGRARPRRAFALLGRELLRRPWSATAAILSLVVDALAGLIPPIAIGLIVDVLSGADTAGGIPLALLLLVVAAVAAGLFGWSAAAFTARVSESAVGALRERALASALTSDAAHIERSGSGDLTARLTADIDRLSEAAGGTITAFVSAALAIVVTFAGLAALDWPFAVAVLLAVPVQALTLRWYLRRSAPVYRAAREAESAREQRLLDVFHGRRAIRALREEDRRSAALADASGEAVRLERAAVALSTRFYGRLNVAECIGLAAILVAGFLLVGSGASTLGAVTTAALFFTRLFGPINTLLGLFDTVQQAGASLTRVVGVIDLAPMSLEKAMPRSAGPASVDARGIEVSYPNGRRALRGVDLRMLPGERVALIGASGSGKSTLARVIAGFVPPLGGRLEVTGGPGAPVLLEQRGHLFAGTLAEDLRLVAPEAGDEQLIAAASEAGLRLGVGRFAAGLHTRLDEAGLTPADAAGVALARLVLADPAVAILDEAGADAGARASEVEATVERVLAGRTSLVVAHHLGQAMTADRVLLLDDGLVVAEGRHADLLRDEPRYRELWRAWRGTLDPV